MSQIFTSSDNDGNLHSDVNFQAIVAFEKCIQEKCDATSVPANRSEFPNKRIQ